MHKCAHTQINTTICATIKTTHRHSEIRITFFQSHSHKDNQICIYIRGGGGEELIYTITPKRLFRISDDVATFTSSSSILSQHFHKMCAAPDLNLNKRARFLQHFTQKTTSSPNQNYFASNTAINKFV